MKSKNFDNKLDQITKLINDIFMKDTEQNIDQFATFVTTFQY